MSRIHFYCLFLLLSLCQLFAQELYGGALAAQKYPLDRNQLVQIDLAHSNKITVVNPNKMSVTVKVYSKKLDRIITADVLGPFEGVIINRAQPRYRPTREMGFSREDIDNYVVLAGYDLHSYENDLRLVHKEIDRRRYYQFLTVAAKAAFAALDQYYTSGKIGLALTVIDYTLGKQSLGFNQGLVEDGVANLVKSQIISVGSTRTSQAALAGFMDLAEGLLSVGSEIKADDLLERTAAANYYRLLAYRSEDQLADLLTNQQRLVPKQSQIPVDGYGKPIGQTRKRNTRKASPDVLIKPSKALFNLTSITPTYQFKKDNAKSTASWRVGFNFEAPFEVSLSIPITSGGEKPAISNRRFFLTGMYGRSNARATERVQLEGLDELEGLTEVPDSTYIDFQSIGGEIMYRRTTAKWFWAFSAGATYKQSVIYTQNGDENAVESPAFGQSLDAQVAPHAGALIGWFMWNKHLPLALTLGARYTRLSFSDSGNLALRDAETLSDYELPQNVFTAMFSLNFELR